MTNPLLCELCGFPAQELDEEGNCYRCTVHEQDFEVTEDYERDYQ